jgi:integrase
MAIEEIRRGIFLCMGLLGLRPGETRALDVADYDWKEHWLDVSRAGKGARLDLPIRGTKTGEGRYLPVPPDPEGTMTPFAQLTRRKIPAARPRFST